MPIRIASLSKRIWQNGQALHQAMASRIDTQGEGAPPSAAETALLAEREQLKKERALREARAAEPGPSAVDRLVRTHHPEAKERPKATKESRATKAAAKASKPHRTRAEKHAAKAAALDAARRAPKKPAAKG